MLVDLEDTFPAESEPYRAGVCIAGAGVAGLVLATKLARCGVRVHLLEAGGRGEESRSQKVYDASMASALHTGTSKGRFRLFGGSSTRWGAELLPYTEEFFSPCADSLSCSWPIKPGDLERFYPEIEDILGTDDLPFTTDLYKRLRRRAPTGLESNPDATLRFSKWAPFAYRNLAKTLGADAISSSRITVFLHANVTECRLAPNGSTIKAFLVQNYRGGCFRFEAEQYVISVGTIETSRLLLASRQICSTGVGNCHDQVGRNFHDHVSASVAHLKGKARDKVLSSFGPFICRGTLHSAKIEANTALRKRLDMLAVMGHFTIEESADSGMFVVREFLRAMQRGDVRSVISHNLAGIPGALLEVCRLGWAATMQNRRAVSRDSVIPLRIVCEQRPRPENRIRLCESIRDTFGMPTTIVDWRISDEELRSIRSYTAWLREEFVRLGVTQIDWHAETPGEDGCDLREIRDTNHPMGGTLMGTDPTRAVVDTDLRVHGIPNLSIASCSTFPRGGSCYPTLSLMALALRLAERLSHIVTPSSGGASQLHTPSEIGKPQNCLQ